jgi:hypothetical protein
MRHRFKTGHHLVFRRADNLVVFVSVFEEIGNVEEGVSLQANIDKCRLHAWQNLGNSSSIDVANDPFGSPAFD